jgi:hypothetical protein
LALSRQKTHPPVVGRLNKGNAGPIDTKIKVRLAEFGGTTLAGSPADFRQANADETEGGVR